jgi:hypothetical protein
MVTEDGKKENGYFGWGADATDRSAPVPASSFSPVVILVGVGWVRSKT